MQWVQRCTSTLPRASRPRAAACVPRPATRSLHVPHTAGSRPQLLVCHTAAADVAAPVQSDNPIALTEKALDHLVKLRSDVGGEQLLLRVGVKQGGCSGLSYHMDFEKDENVNEDDTIMEYDSGKFRIVCDPKSLLYLFGMHMDYSDALIGGGFKFSNPNATDNCGCGKSFGV